MPSSPVAFPMTWHALLPMSLLRCIISTSQRNDLTRIDHCPHRTGYSFLSNCSPDCQRMVQELPCFMLTLTKCLATSHAAESSEFKSVIRIPKAWTRFVSSDLVCFYVLASWLEQTLRKTITNTCLPWEGRIFVTKWTANGYESE